MRGAHFHRGRRAYTLKIFRGLRKTKTKKAYGKELIPCQALRRTSASLSDMGVLYDLRRVDLQHVQWLAQSTWKSQRKPWRRERKGICTSIWQCSYSCALPWKLRVLVRRANSKRALPKSNLSVRRAFLPELHHSSWEHPWAFAPRSTPGRSPAQLQTLFFNRRTCHGSEKKANRKWKETGFQCQRMAKMFPPVHLPPSAFRAVFCMHVRSSPWRVELRHDVFAHAPLARQKKTPVKKKILRPLTCSIFGTAPKTSHRAQWQLVHKRLRCSRNHSAIRDRWERERERKGERGVWKRNKVSAKRRKKFIWHNVILSGYHQTSRSRTTWTHKPLAHLHTPIRPWQR